MPCDGSDGWDGDGRECLGPPTEAEELRARFLSLGVAVPPNKAGRPYLAMAESIGELVEAKQLAYGDSFGKSGQVLALLYPHGIATDKLTDALAIVRVVDKLFRIATDRDALGESPWKDVAGYAILSAVRTARGK